MKNRLLVEDMRLIISVQKLKKSDVAKGIDFFLVDFREEYYRERIDRLREKLTFPTFLSAIEYIDCPADFFKEKNIWKTEKAGIIENSNIVWVSEYFPCKHSGYGLTGEELEKWNNDQLASHIAYFTIDPQIDGKADVTYQEAEDFLQNHFKD